jgi:hypothetical protein
LDKGEILLEGLFQLSFDQLAHGMAFEKGGIVKMFSQLGF